MTNKLQKFQNTAAQLFKHKSKFEHITLALRELHWLPVEQKSAFKGWSFNLKDSIQITKISARHYTSIHIC